MIAIIAAMAQEMEILKSKLISVEKISVSSFEFLSGRLGNQEVVLLQCGIGKVNAAVGCALLIDRFKPEAVINTGSAGGLKANQTFGDIVISRSVVHHDVDVTAFGYSAGQVPGFEPQFMASPGWIEIATTSLNHLRVKGLLPASLGFSVGTIGSGDVFVHEPSLIDKIRTTFPDLCAVEMESAAIAQTCQIFHTPFVIIRALSDIAGQESPMKFDEFLPLAAQRSSELVMEMVRTFKKE